MISVHRSCIYLLILVSLYIKFPFILQNTKRLSPPEEEYRHTSTLENHKTKVHNEGETEKDQVNISEEIVPNKIKQNIIHGT